MLSTGAGSPALLTRFLRATVQRQIRILARVKRALPAQHWSNVACGLDVSLASCRPLEAIGPLVMLNVGMIGTGYVGLVTGACLSELGHNVVCVDSDAVKIARLNKGEMPIYEPGLAELVAANTGRGFLSFTTDLDEAVAPGVDVLFIAVGTPSDGNGGGAHLGYVHAAVEQAARALARHPAGANRFTVIVTKSTVPVGTSRKVAAIVGEHIATERFAVASN